LNGKRYAKGQGGSEKEEATVLNISSVGLMAKRKIKKKKKTGERKKVRNMYKRNA